jgi:hypothetical protein
MVLCPPCDGEEFIRISANEFCTGKVAFARVATLSRKESSRTTMRSRSRYFVPYDFELTPARACLQGGYVRPAYIELRHHCTQHYQDTIVRELERRTRAANEMWLRACEAEQRYRAEWKCKCGFIGTYDEREAHFVAEPSYAHLPMSTRRYVLKDKLERQHVKPVMHKRAAGYVWDD